MTGIICSSPVYEYKGWTFEYRRHGFTVPWPLCKDGTLRKRAGNKFWEMWSEWRNLPGDEQETYRVRGV